MTRITRARRSVARVVLGVAVAVPLGVGVGVGLPADSRAEAPGTGTGSGTVGEIVDDLLGTEEQPSAEPSRRSLGRTRAPDGRLRHGCHNYPYRYVVSTPTRDWTLETFLIDPRGEGIASGAFMADSDPARQRTHFRFCSQITRPGRFTIRARVHWYRGGEDHKAWFIPSHFRLSRR